MKTQLRWGIGPEFTYAVKDRYVIQAIYNQLDEEWEYSIWYSLKADGNSVKLNQWEQLECGYHGYNRVNDMRLVAESSLRQIMKERGES